MPMHVDADLMEFNVGSLEGRDIVETKRAHGLNEHDSFMTILPDDADKWHEFVPRICTSVRHWTEKHSDETVLVAAHGLVFRALTIALADEHLVSQNAEPYFFEPAGSTWRIEKIG